MASARLGAPKSLKLLTIGDSGVGKSCLLARYAKDDFVDTHITTIGIDFQVKTVEIDGESVQVQVWDTAGQERFRNITKSYFRGSDGILCVYDVTSRHTFNAVENWFTAVREKAGKDVVLVVVGNKCDLNDKRCVTMEEGAALAKRLGVPFLETSAKAPVNVEKAFTMLATAAYAKKVSLGGSRSGGGGGGVALDGGRGGGKKGCAC